MFLCFLKKGKVLNAIKKELSITLDDIDYFEHDILKLKNSDFYRIDLRDNLLKSIEIIDKRNGVKSGKEFSIRKLSNTNYFYIKQDF